MELYQLKDRIKYLRKEILKLNQKQFGERIGVQQGSIASYEKGYRDPLDSIILSICREFDVSEEWLRTGEGEVFVTRLEMDEEAMYIANLLDAEKDHPFYSIILAIMKSYEDLDDTSKEVVHLMIQNFKKNMQQKKED